MKLIFYIGCKTKTTKRVFKIEGPKDHLSAITSLRRQLTAHKELIFVTGPVLALVR